MSVFVINYNLSGFFPLYVILKVEIKIDSIFFYFFFLPRLVKGAKKALFIHLEKIRFKDIYAKNSASEEYSQENNKITSLSIQMLAEDVIFRNF